MRKIRPRLGGGERGAKSPTSKDAGSRCECVPHWPHPSSFFGEKKTHSCTQMQKYNAKN